VFRLAVPEHGAPQALHPPPEPFAVAVSPAACRPAASQIGRELPNPLIGDVRVVARPGPPYCGDRRLLATVSTGGRLRARAVVGFTLRRPGTVTITPYAVNPSNEALTAVSGSFTAGRHHLVWTPPAGTPERTYLLRTVVTDGSTTVRLGAWDHGSERLNPAPVVRVQGVDAGFPKPSYVAGDHATMSVATTARRLTVQIFRAGAGTGGGSGPERMNGRAVTPAAVVRWPYPDHPGRLSLQIGGWPSGVYFARLQARDGHVGYAPFVLRSAAPGRDTNVAVVMPTNTWEAYNFQDVDGDGWGDTWYASSDIHAIDTTRPYIRGGRPSHWRNRGFLDWLTSTHRSVDFLTDADLDATTAGALRSRYRLIVFAGHEEYVTPHEYHVIARFRDLGGNLMFLASNNLYWKVVRRGSTLTRIDQWRDLGKPEAAIVGAQYVANDLGQHQGPYEVLHTSATRWFFAGTGLENGSSFGNFGVEFDMTAAASPPGTVVLASVNPHLPGNPDVRGEMTLYRRGDSTVFDAGTLTFGLLAGRPVEARMLDNLWARMTKP